MSKKELDTVEIAGVRLISTSEQGLLAFLASKIARNQKIFLATLNPEFAAFARHNAWFKKILDRADVAVPDGIGFVWAGKLLGKPIKERISGTDLMEKLCQEAAQQGWSVYLIGGKPGVAKEAFSVLKKRYPGLRGWAESGPILELVDGNWLSATKKEASRLIQEINSQKPDLLFVAYGMGKQEKFIADNWGKLRVKLAMGVGGAFDYLSKQVPRAPKWARRIGLEWLYRLLLQPWRWKRQLRLIAFIWLVFQERFGKKEAF